LWIAYTVYSAGVSSSHTGHRFSADLAMSHLLPNNISTDTNRPISGASGDVAFRLSIIDAIIWGIFFELVTVENLRIAAGISTISLFQRYKYFRFRRPYCYFRLSVADAIIWGHFLWRRCRRKVRHCHLNYNDTGSVWHCIKYRQFQNKIHTCLTSCQTTSGAPLAPWILIVAFCTHFIFRKSHERTAPIAEWNFLLIQKLSWGFFYPKPKRNTRVKQDSYAWILLSCSWISCFFVIMQIYSISQIMWFMRIQSWMQIAVINLSFADCDTVPQISTASAAPITSY